MISHLTRASVRRLVTLTPKGARSPLRSTLVAPELAGPLPVELIEQRCAAYLLDRSSTPILAFSDDDQTWLTSSQLLRMIGPTCAVPISDDLAAIIAAPRLVDGDHLSEALLRMRFAPRADEAVAAAVARLSAEGAVAAIDALAAPGPDEATLHLALLQAGRALAWRPELAAPAVTDALLALLDRNSPQPLLAAASACLGPIAAKSPRVRDAVLERLRTARDKIENRRPTTSFLDELKALDRTRTMPDEDYFMTLPDRQVAAAAAEILGRSAEHLTRDGFIALRMDVLDGDLGDALLPSFIDGLIAAAAVEPLTELVAQLVDTADEETRLLGLHVAAQLPLDACGEVCLACLEDRRAPVRAAAILAVALLEAERAVPALLERLDDPAPEVCARAARALVDHGQIAAIAERHMPGELAVGKTRERTAAARAALPTATLDVASVLLSQVAGQAELVESPRDVPLLEALTSVLSRSTDGLQIAAAFVREIPEALPIVALALETDDPTPIVIPELVRAELAAVLDPIIATGGDNGMLALEALARFSLGNTAMVGRILEAAREDGYAQFILSALAHVRVRTESVADYLARWLDDREFLAATLLATAVAGVALPVDHRLWEQIRELLSLGTHAATAAYTALANRHRCKI